MLKKRLIFTLLIQNGIFQLSRNFSLQAVGDIKWLYDNFNFDSIAYSIDELVLLNVTRGDKNVGKFIPSVEDLSRRNFMPIAAGGGIRSLSDAFNILNAGADKLIVNTPLFRQPELIRDLVRTFGSQCIVASIDYKGVDSNFEVFISNGAEATGMNVKDAVLMAEELGAGEIYITSIERDGTGHGYDVDILSRVVDICHVPVIASGGVGDYEHFVTGMRLEKVTGASTANIFNFIGTGLSDARNHINERGIDLAIWDFGMLCIE